MLYRTMKKTGDALSILGFGCMRLPEKKGKIDEQRATNQIRYAVDHGVNYVDTAFGYHRGACEPFLGRALSDGYREKVKLATKLPHWIVKTREDMDKVLSTQMDNLKTNFIDYYLVHNLNGDSWKRSKILGVVDFLNQAKTDERILYAGFSFHGAKDDFKKIVDSHDWDFCQIQYNFLDEENQAGIEGLKYAAAKELGVIVMEPLRGGHLASSMPPAVEAVWKEAETKRTPVEWALRWIWNHPEVTIVLSGMNHENQIEENIRIAGEAYPESLTVQELQLVSRVEGTYRRLMKAGCTGCRYCIPCPSGVNIPVCLEHYNAYHMFDNRRRTKMVYPIMLGGLIDGKPGFASQCTDCGECLENCPQHLPIPELLREVAKDMEGLMTKPMMWLGKQFMVIQRRRAMRKAEKLEKQRRKEGKDKRL